MTKPSDVTTGEDNRERDKLRGFVADPSPGDIRLRDWFTVLCAQALSTYRARDHCIPFELRDRGVTYR